jgi:hypothetical protein
MADLMYLLFFVKYFYEPNIFRMIYIMFSFVCELLVMTLLSYSEYHHYGGLLSIASSFVVCVASSPLISFVGTHKAELLFSVLCAPTHM